MPFLCADAVSAGGPHLKGRMEACGTADLAWRPQLLDSRRFVESRLKPLGRTFIEEEAEAPVLVRAHSFADFTPYRLEAVGVDTDEGALTAAATTAECATEQASVDIAWPDTDDEEDARSESTMSSAVVCHVYSTEQPAFGFAPSWPPPSSFVAPAGVECGGASAAGSATPLSLSSHFPGTASRWARRVSVQERAAEALRKVRGLSAAATISTPAAPAPTQRPLREDITLPCLLGFEAATAARAAACGGPCAAERHQAQPSAEKPLAAEQTDGPCTTMMLRNLPQEVTTRKLVEELCISGFAGQFDFCYVPCSFATGAGKGFGFVNFSSPVVAAALCQVWRGRRHFGGASLPGPLSLSPAAVQGKGANVSMWQGPHRRRIRNPELRPFIAGC